MRPAFAIYLLRRALLTVPVVLGVVTIAFIVTKLVPGDPLAGFIAEGATREQYESLSHEFGLDQPIHVQWYRYIGRMVRGQFGRSLRTGNSVAKDLGPAASATLELALVAFALTLVIGVPMGVYAAARQGRIVDQLLSLASLGGVAAPLFWTALMAQVLFYGVLGWLPLGGRLDEYLTFTAPVNQYTGMVTVDAVLNGSWIVFLNALVHLILPASILAYRASALVVRLTRSAMLDVLHSQYIRTAQSVGLAEWRIITRWAFPNALLPIITVLGLTFGQLLQGSILVEAVFNWPGLGLYTVQSILRLDHPGVIAASMVVTLGYVITNAIVDLLYPVVDPRLKVP